MAERVVMLKFRLEKLFKDLLTTRSLWDIIPQNTAANASFSSLQSTQVNRSSRVKTSQTASESVGYPKRLMIAASMACTASFFVVACGGGAASPPETPKALTETSKQSPAELTASSPGELLNYVKTKLKDAAAAGSALNTGGMAMDAVVPSPAPASSANALANFSGTRLQELGVEEDDLLKTDGKMLYALTRSYADGTRSVPAQLQAQRRLAGGQLAAVGNLSLGIAERRGLYLASAEKRIVVLGQQYSYSAATIDPIVNPALGLSAAPNPRTQQIGLDVVALDVPGTLTLAKTVRMDGELVGSRMIGKTLYVVSTWSPDLLKYALPATATATERDAKLASLTSAEVLPSVQIDNGPTEPLLADSDCYVHASNAALRVQITSVTAFDLSSPTLQRDSKCFVGGVEGLYMSPTNVYLTSSRFYSFDTGTTALANAVFKSGTTTDIHKFSLQGQSISYRGSAEVPGHLGWSKDKLAYRMSEYQGDLRVLSFTGATGWALPAPVPGILPSNLGNNYPTVIVSTSQGTAVSATPVPISTAPASPSTLTILREVSGKGLQVVGNLPNAQRPAALGHPGEQVYAVQFVGPRAYVVTFRQTDPLYVLDISNPADPKTLGELSMPGFSDYLYPLGDALLLGVGKDATSSGFIGGVKVALVDVTDPSNPSVLSAAVIGQRGSSATLDYTSHGINVLQQGGLYRIALPIRVNETVSPFIMAPQTFYQPTYQGLHRFEIDTTAKTMISKPTINSVVYSPTEPYPRGYGLFDVSHDRSVQIQEMVYYFSGGQFISASW
jgi:hypothetical protein